MFKKFLIILILSLPLSNCANLNEVNEKVKGDGVPYIPGI